MTVNINVTFSKRDNDVTFNPRNVGPAIRIFTGAYWVTDADENIVTDTDALIVFKVDDGTAKTFESTFKKKDIDVTFRSKP